MMKAGILFFICACGHQVVELGLAPKSSSGGSGSTTGGTTGGTGGAPTIVSVLPVNAAMDVDRDTAISATFSQAMNAATLDATTFTVMQGASAVTGAITYADATNTATFTPTAPLSGGVLYTSVITIGVKDAAGLALAASETWSFTTAAAPTVVSTDPLGAASNVSISKRPTATFSQAMDPTTLTALTFTVKQGTTPVSGTVTLDASSTTATFAPAAALGLSLPYTVTVTTGAKDTGNAALAANHVWSFTTAACGQTPVNLRSAASFAVLAGSTVTNAGLTSITGDLGVSPGTAVTGFPPGTLDGVQHAGDGVAAQGVADIATAYSDAKSRALCPIAVSGDLGGQTLLPGLYQSAATLAISVGDLTLDAQGDSDAVFIIGMEDTLTVDAAREITLIHGAQASNVFWRVGTSATLGAASACQGTILADQSITFDAGATLSGRALAHYAAVTLQSNSIATP
jgi:hypothetical protein